MIETLIDPNISVIIAELENGEKDSIYLTKKLRLSLDEIKARLSYVIEHGFVMMINSTKLWKVMKTLQM